MNSTTQHPNPPEVTNPRTNTPRPSREPRPRSTVGEIWMAIFVATTVVIYIILVCVSVETLHIDQRAWLEIFGTASVNPEFVKENSQILASTNVTNSGKTPARKIIVQFVTVILNSTDSVKFDYDGKGGRTDTGILIPKESIPIRIYGGGDPLKPEVFTKTQADALLAGRMYVATYGRGEYKDIFGNEHWFHHCRYAGYYPGGAYYNASGCVAYNDVGDGYLPEGRISPE